MASFCRKFLYLSTIWSTSHFGLVDAQNSRIFDWKFGGNSVSQSLPACQSIPVVVQPFNFSSPNPGNSTGVPPYFMLALGVGSETRVYPLGSDLNSLHFTVDFPPSTELILTVIDSNNTAGGVPPNSFNVVSGQDEFCVKPVNANSGFTISTNVSNTVNTCDPWGITVKGGVSPYRWTLAAIKSPVVTNVTGLKGEDELVYIMRGDVGQRLFVTASDFTGRFAYGTPEITPQGSIDVTCRGRNSRTGNSTVFAAQKEAADRANSSAAQKRSVIIGVTTTLIILVVVGIIGGWFYVRHRRGKRAPTPFTSGKKHGFGHDLTIVPYRSVPRSSESEEDLILHDELEQAAIFGSFPPNSAIRKKFKTSSREHAGSPNVESPSSSNDAVRIHQEGHEIVIQHQDANDIVRELPPPYVDRSSLGASGSGSGQGNPMGSQQKI